MEPAALVGARVWRTAGFVEERFIFVPDIRPGPKNGERSSPDGAGHLFTRDAGTFALQDDE